MEMWLSREGKIRYSFYEKPEAKKTCVLKNSAMADNAKKAIMVSEVRRRLMNMDEEVEKEEKCKVLDIFGEKITRSGYKKEEIIRVIMDGIKGHERKVKKCKEEGWDIRRDG